MEGVGSFSDIGRNMAMEVIRSKKMPRRKARRLMFSQRNNPYCDLLIL